MPPVLARHAHRVDQIVIITGGARRMRAVRGALVVRCRMEDGKDRRIHLLLNQIRRCGEGLYAHPSRRGPDVGRENDETRGV